MTKEEAVYYLIKPIVTSTIPANETVKQLEAWSMAVKALDGAFEPKHGYWRAVEPTLFSDRFATCSVCGVRQLLDKDNFCPNCGAKMDGGEDD